MIKNVGLEKDNQLKEFMRIAGMSRYLQWSAWFTKYFVFLFIIISIMTVVLCVSRGKFLNEMLILTQLLILLETILLDPWASYFSKEQHDCDLDFFDAVHFAYDWFLLLHVNIVQKSFPIS